MAKYTTLEQINLPTVADSYGLDDPRLAPLSGGAANSSFRLSTASDEFVLTIRSHRASPASRSAPAASRPTTRLSSRNSWTGSSQPGSPIDSTVSTRPKRQTAARER